MQIFIDTDPVAKIASNSSHLFEEEIEIFNFSARVRAN